MSSKRKRLTSPKTDNPDASYEVGFGKPPLHGRFKPGHSGNPKGRPKGSRNRPPSEFEDNRLRAIIEEEANRMITIQDANGKRTKISTKQAVVRSIAVNALKGRQQSQRHFTDLVSEKERAEKRERDAILEQALDYKIAWERELERRKAQRISGPDPLPRPDDVVIDFATGMVRIAGPMTKEEKISWPRWQKFRATYEKELKDLKAQLDDPNCGVDEVLVEIEKTENVLTIIEAALDGSREVMKLLEDAYSRG